MTVRGKYIISQLSKTARKQVAWNDIVNERVGNDWTKLMLSFRSDGKILAQNRSKRFGNTDNNLTARQKRSKN